MRRDEKRKDWVTPEGTVLNGMNSDAMRQSRLSRINQDGSGRGETELSEKDRDLTEWDMTGQDKAVRDGGGAEWDGI